MKFSSFMNYILAKAHYIYSIICLFFGLFISLAIISYNRLDPSLLRITDAKVTNLAGWYGALLTGPLLQLLGYASIVIAIIILLWSGQLFFNKIITYPLLRSFIMVICLLSLSINLASFDITANYGGVIGGLISYYLLNYLSINLLFYLCLIISLITFFIASAISFKDWQIIINNCNWFIKTVIRSTKLLILIIIKMINKNNLTKQLAPIIINSEINKTDIPIITSNEISNLKDQLKSSFKKPIIEQVISKKASSIKIIKGDQYLFPPLNLLAIKSEKNKKSNYSETELQNNAYQLEQVLKDFGIKGKIGAIHPGPVVTLYELEPAAGTKSARVVGLADDIARSMSATSARIAVISGRNAIGIELPNISREVVYLRELLEFEQLEVKDPKLPIMLGKDIGGKAIIVDLAKMPHLLVAGTTGSGKSVAINTMILSLIYRLTPAQCKFIMIDPKMLELSVYDGIPHLLTPVVTEPKSAVLALRWVVREMENRYRLMAQLGVRNIAGYNDKIQEAISRDEVIERTVQTGFDVESGKPIFEKISLAMELLPFIVVIVDEMADLMLVAGKDIESLIQRLSQMARAAGIHIVMATQRPSVDVITGVIKANFPTRISFQVTTRIDSRTILGEQGGAEQLLGMGDMLYMSSGSRIIRVHGPFASDKEVEEVVNFLKSQGEPEYIDEIIKDEEQDQEDSNFDKNPKDELYNQALEIITRDKKASTSYLQRTLRIGYNRAAIIIEQMEKDGVISAANHVGKREILINS